MTFDSKALRTDPDLADQVWELWNTGVITDDLAAWAWSILVYRMFCPFRARELAMQKLTTAEFVAKCKKVHGGKYDYSASEYSSAHKKLKVICSGHGAWLVSPANHMEGRGCPKCARYSTQTSNRLGTERFWKKPESCMAKRALDWYQGWPSRRCLCCKPDTAVT